MGVTAPGAPEVRPGGEGLAQALPLLSGGCIIRCVEEGGKVAENRVIQQNGKNTYSNTHTIQNTYLNTYQLINTYWSVCHSVTFSVGIMYFFNE